MFLWPRGSTAAVALVFSPVYITAIVMPIGAGAGCLLGRLWRWHPAGRVIAIVVGPTALGMLMLGLARPELFPTSVLTRRARLERIGPPRVVEHDARAPCPSARGMIWCAMTSRRHFLQIGITATAWPLVSRAAHASWTGPGPALPLLGVVYDTRFTESVAFARRSAALGLRTHAIAGDMTRLWYDEVYHHWRQSPTALAGLTAHGPMFCFAELARDVGMRIVFRAEHRGSADGAIAHAFTGPVSMLSTSLDACGTPDRLWAAMADVVSNCPGGRTEIASATRVSGTAPPGRDPLYTWVIAPVVKTVA